MSRRAKLLLLPLLILIPLLWVRFLFTAPPQANDFYPLYFAAQRVLAGESPYGLEASIELGETWNNPYSGYGRAGVAYPLPLILLVIPLSFFILPIATFLWTALGFISSYFCVLISQRQSLLRRVPEAYQWLSLLLPFTFYPLYRAVELSQATLLWFGMAVLLLICIRRREVKWVAILIVLLMLKPQNGLLFALYGIYWLAREERKGLLYVGIWGGALLGLSLLVQPQWIMAWVEQVGVYRSIVQPPSLLPVGLIMLVVFWRYELWVLVAIAQVVLFPMSDVYSTLPLLLVWCAFSPPVALIGSVFSWLWVLFSGPTPTSMLWLLLFMPLMLALLWERRPAALQRGRARTYDALRQQSRLLHIPGKVEL